jgi:hypothetical protein
MAADAVVGLVGVSLGAASTSILTVYKERFTARREREARDDQRRREREDQRNIFQRDCPCPAVRCIGLGEVRLR